MVLTDILRRVLFRVFLLKSESRSCLLGYTRHFKASEGGPNKYARFLSPHLFNLLESIEFLLEESSIALMRVCISGLSGPLQA